MVRGWTLLIVEVKLSRHVNHMVTPIDFGGHSSKMKVTMGIIDKSGVRWDATLCVVIFYYCYLHMVAAGELWLLSDNSG